MALLSAKYGTIQHMKNLSLSSRIESILFFKGEPVAVSELSKILKVSEEEVLQGARDLESALSLQERGITLLRNGNEISLGTVPEMSTTIEALLKEELVKDLGKAGLETLAIVLYRGPISRTEINYIRGVNSNYILRNLLVRGLVEKDENSTARSTIYKPTFELLSYMGISKVEDLPEYQGVTTEVESFKNGSKEDGYEEDEVLDETR